MIKLKTNILRIRFILFLLFTSSFAMAQESESKVVYVSNNPTGTGISVRWISAEFSYVEGVNIYRKENTGNWVLLNAKPIMPPTASEPEFQLSDRGRQFYDNYLSLSRQEFMDNFDAIMTMIESVKEYNLALALHIAYTDKTAQIGTNYQYKVEGIKKGKKEELGITEIINCQVYTPQPGVMNIEVIRKKKMVFVNWLNELETYYAYDVYEKKADEEWKLVGDHIASEAIKNLKKEYLRRKTSDDTLYTYKMIAYDYFGQKSEMSDEYIAPIIDFVPPADAVIRITVDAKKMAVRIAWNPVPDKDLSHYVLLRSGITEDSTFMPINKQELTAKDTVYIDYPDNAGSYFYRLDAYDVAGNRSKSEFVNGNVYDIRPPEAPQYLISAVDTGKLILNWEANSEKDLMGYRLFRSVADEDNSDNTFVIVSSVIIDTNYYVEPMSKNVRSVFAYQVRAVDSSFNLSDPSNIVLAQMPDVTPPVAPFIKKSYEKDNALIVEWMPNVEKDLMAYNIYKKAKGDTLGFEKLNISPIPKNLTTYADKTAERGQFYEYYIEAIDNSDLVSPMSNTLLGKLEFLPLAGSIEITKSKLNKNSGQVNIAWKIDGLINEPIIGTAIFKSVDGKKARQIGVVSDKHVFKEKLSKTAKYEYHIRAYGDRGSIIKSEIIVLDFIKQ